MEKNDSVLDEILETDNNARFNEYPEDPKDQKPLAELNAGYNTLAGSLILKDPESSISNASNGQRLFSWDDVIQNLDRYNWIFYSPQKIHSAFQFNAEIRTFVPIRKSFFQRHSARARQATLHRERLKLF